MRTIMACGLMAVLVAAATSESRACDACAAFFKANQRHQGKLIKVTSTEPGISWKLQTADGTYRLKLASRYHTRLAASLEGRDVAVTGPLAGGEIDVRELEASAS